MRAITREAMAAVRSARRMRRLIHKPLAPSTASMPRTKRPHTNNASGSPPKRLAASAKSAAWEIVSKEMAKSAPTAATAHGLRTVTMRPRSRERIPVGETTAPAGARTTARTLSHARPKRNAMEIEMPVYSSQPGACHPDDTAPAPSATRQTTAPCPSEKSAPHRRERAGLVGAL